jgi:SAM-dependent methyltransferase
MTHIIEITSADLKAQVAGDALPSDGAQLPDDIVLPIGGAARTLLHLTPRKHFSRVWDLGCGSGVQSAIAAQHSDIVIATDIDQRSLDYTNQSAALNNLTNIETRLGSMFDPVENEKFDLIVSNPPFVIGNVTTLTHRESPFTGDDLTKELLTNIPHHLTHNGIAIILTTWLITTDDWRDRIEEWLPEDCGVWIGLRDIQSVDEYVTTWMKDAGIDDEKVKDTWQQQLNDMHANAIAFGFIVFDSDSSYAIMEDVRNAPALPDGVAVLERIHRARVADQLTAMELMTSTFEADSSQPWRGGISLDGISHRLWTALDGVRLLPEIVAEIALATSHDEDDVLVLSLVGLKELVGVGLARPVTLR